MNLEEELRQIAAEESEKNKSEVVFPDVQKVEVTNFPEEKEGTEKVEVTNWPEQKPVIVPAPEVKVETTQVTVEQADLTQLADMMAKQADLLNRIAEKEIPSFDYERYDALLAKNKPQPYKGGAVSSKRNILDTSGKAIDPLDRDKQIDTSSAAALNNGENYTTGWIDRQGFVGIKVAFKTDQNGYFTIEYSPDTTNTDSTLTRYYRTNQIEAPHKFENMRRYVRVTFYNNSGSNQTYLRPDISLTNSSGMLNIPQDATMSQDYDAISTRPSDFNMEVALGRRQGYSLWNKFGYNNDIDTGTEVIASFGGTFTPLTTATTLTIVSSDAADDDGGTGLNSIVVYGVDANRDEQVEVVTMNGTTNVVTTSTWLGVNRVAMFLCGTGQVNAGTITVTATTGGSTMAQMPAGGGVTQQCIFYVPQNHQFIAEWLRVNTLKQAAQNPKVTVKMWVYSPINNGKQEVYKVDIDTSVSNDVSENPNLPFPISEKSVVWLEATTDKDNTIVNARFSGILARDVDA